MNNSGRTTFEIENFKELSLQEQARLLDRNGRLIGVSIMAEKRIAHYRMGALGVTVESLAGTSKLIAIYAEVVVQDPPAANYPQTNSLH